MFPKSFVAVLALMSFCSGAPLELDDSLEARASLGAVAIENGLLDVQLGYQSIADHVVFLGPDAPPQINQIVVAVYKDTIKNLQPIPAKSGPEYPKAVQLSLCNAGTTIVTLSYETCSILYNCSRPTQSSGNMRNISLKTN